MRFVAPAGYELLAPLGCGSVFDVAVVRKGSAELVCKRLRPSLADHDGARAAMDREARVLAAVQLETVPALIEEGMDAHGPFVVQERAVGIDLRALAARSADRGGISAELALRVAREACRTLAEIHEHGDDRGPLDLVHADICPDHLILTPAGRVALVDWGASRARVCAGLEPSADRGTVPYAAPEVLRGEVPPSRATDVYALAASILFMVTARPIVPRPASAAALARVAEHGIPAAALEHPSVPARLRAALEKALSPAPPRSVGDARALLALVTD